MASEHTVGFEPADADKEVLFRQFQAWEAEQSARTQATAVPRQR